MDRSSASSAAAQIEAAKLRGAQDIAAIREQKKMDIGGELLKGAGQLAAEVDWSEMFSE